MSGSWRTAAFLLSIACMVTVLAVLAGFAQEEPLQSPDAEGKDINASEPIEKTEEAREQEKMRKFEQTQYELEEMGMTREERKMRRVQPQKP